MNKTHRIKVLGLLGLPLLAVALAVMVFAWGSSSDSADAAEEGAAMSMSISPTQDCPGAKDPGDVCVAVGGNFTVTVSTDAIPAEGFVGYSTFLQFLGGGLNHNEAGTSKWPDGAAGGVTFLCSSNATFVSCGELTGLIDPPASFHKGALVNYEFSCKDEKSQGNVIELLTLNQAPAGTSGASIAVFEGPIISVPGSQVTVNCTNPNTPTPTPTDTPTPTPTPTDTPAPIPRMQKLPLLQNVFLTRQGAKIPPPDCLAGTDVGVLVEGLNQAIVSADPKGVTGFQTLAAFEFEVHYDATKVCVTVIAAPFFPAAETICIVEDSQSKPQLEGVARVGCFTQGKGHEIDESNPLAAIIVWPQPDVYSQAKPNQDNGVVVQINNVDCDLSDEQGHAIPIFSCDDADITFRYLEGDVDADCDVDAADAAAIAFRWGSEKGSLVYKDFMNLEPSGTQSDNDIDINDLQFVFGRFGSDCDTPHPDQDPVNPKA